MPSPDAQPGALRLQVLGPLRVWRGGEEVNPGPRQRALLLAVLLARAGQPVGTSELVDLLWGEDPPPSALNVIRKYAGELRRLLEPGLRPRGEGRYLARRGSAYVFTATGGELDLVEFRASLARAGAAQRDGRTGEALDHHLDALARWQGPAGGELATWLGVSTVFAVLDEEFRAACVAAADLAAALGRSDRVLPALQLAARTAPLHEPLHARLIRSLAAADQRAEALSVAGAVTRRLRDELGIDPSVVLRSAHDDVLRTPPAARTAPPEPAPQPRAAAPRPVPVAIVGRLREQEQLREFVRTALGGTTFGAVLVEGEAGAGKTLLVEHAALRASADGVLIAWGRCLDGSGAPSMWPWVQVVGTLLESLPPDERAALAGRGLDRLVGRAHTALDQPLTRRTDGLELAERIVDVLAVAAGAQPVALVVDDLQWADPASLDVLDALVRTLPPRIVLLCLVRSRRREPNPELDRTLVALARAPVYHRVSLGPLTFAEVTELIARESGAGLDERDVDEINQRAGGNAFFVKELARLRSSAPADQRSARSKVPASVQEAIRERMAPLGRGTAQLLQVAALIGGDVDIEVLADVADLGVEECVAGLEPAIDLGMLDLSPADPFSFRFTHDLVREAVSDTTPPRLVLALHLRVADALERITPGAESAVEQIAHHLSAAGPLADPRRAAQALIRAGRLAVSKSALGAAHRALTTAARIARRADLDELELEALAELTAVAGMQTLYGTAGIDVLVRAEELARRLGDELRATYFLYSRWITHGRLLELDLSRPLVARLRADAERSDDPLIRAIGLQAWGLQCYSDGDLDSAYRHLNQAAHALDRGVTRADDPMWHDLRLMMAGVLAEASALQGDVERPRSLLAPLLQTEDRFAITVVSAHAARAESFMGDTRAALEVSERGIAQDPEFTFQHNGTYLRLVNLWARALRGADPTAACRAAAELIDRNLLNPPRVTVAVFLAHLGEMWLAAGDLDRAEAALDRAEGTLALGQAYGEGLILLNRARLLVARGAPVEAIRAVADACRAASARRGTPLFARRMDEFLATVDARGATGAGADGGPGA